MTHILFARGVRLRFALLGAAAALPLLAWAAPSAALIAGPAKAEPAPITAGDASATIPNGQGLAQAGYAAIKVGDLPRGAQDLAAALDAGGLAASQTRDIRLSLSDVLAQLGRPAESAAVLAPLAAEQSYDVQARLAFALDASGRKAEAVQAFLAAEALASTPEARLLMAKGRIYALVVLDRRAEAIAASEQLDRAGHLPGKDAIELAYISLKFGDDPLAERLFASANRQHQLSGAAALDAGYTARRSRHEADAVLYFKIGLATAPKPSTPAQAQARFELEREVAELSRRWGAYALLSYDNTRSVVAAGPGTNRGNSQAGFEAYYRPLGSNAGQPVEVFVRAFETLGSRRGDPTGAETLQGWIGIRDKPFASQNLVVEASRMVKLGRLSRNDWMVRAGYSATTGLDLRQDQSSWLLTHAFVDVARLFDAKETVAVAEGRLGRAFRLGPQGELILIPFVGLSATYDSGLSNPTAVGAGPGLWVRQWFRSEDLTAPQSYIDMVFQYRARVGGDRRAEGFIATLSVSY